MSVNFLKFVIDYVKKNFSKNRLEQLFLTCAFVTTPGLVIFGFSAIIDWVLASDWALTSWILMTMGAAILLIVFIFILLAILFPDIFDDVESALAVASNFVLICVLAFPKIVFTILNFIIVLIVFAWLNYKFQSTRTYNFIISRWSN